MVEEILFGGRCKPGCSARIKVDWVVFKIRKVAESLRISHSAPSISILITIFKFFKSSLCKLLTISVSPTISTLDLLCQLVKTIGESIRLGSFTFKSKKPDLLETAWLKSWIGLPMDLLSKAFLVRPLNTRGLGS